MKPSEALSKAIDILSTKGWAQGTYGRLRGNHCAIGAINLAIFGDHQLLSSLNEELQQVKVDIKAKIKSRVGQGAIGWNDEPGRNATEVVAVLKDVQSFFESAGR